MNWFNVLNYLVFNWYKKRDNMPVLYTVLFSSTLICFNVFILIGVACFLFNTPLPGTKIYWLLSVLIIIGINYLVLFKNKKYEKYFKEIDSKKEGKLFKRYKQYSYIYIITTIVLLLLVLIIADIRFDGHL